MKKNYLNPEIEIIYLASEDICVTSGNEGDRSLGWGDLFNDDGTPKELEF